MRSSPSIPTWLACHEVLPYWTNSNNSDRYWNLSGKLHIGLPRSPQDGAVPSIPSYPWFGVWSLGLGEPSPCHVIERDAWHLCPLKNQQVGNNRDSPIRDERIDSSRRQPQMNERELGDRVPMASSLLTAMPAASSEVWSHPSSGRGGTGGSGSWTKALTGSPLAPSSTYIPTRFRCHEGPRYWPNPRISRDPSFGVRLLQQGEPGLWHVIERCAWHLFPLKNQRVGNNRGRSIRAERTASLRA